VNPPGADAHDQPGYGDAAALVAVHLPVPPFKQQRRKDRLGAQLRDAGQPVELRASFHLEPGYFFDHGIISGHIGAVALEATAERISGGLGSTSTVAVDGKLGGTDFTIYAAVDGPLTTGKIRGTVAGAAIRIDAARRRQPGAEKTRLTGSYEGPPSWLRLLQERSCTLSSKAASPNVLPSQR
jgi:hypothetical protein